MDKCCPEESIVIVGGIQRVCTSCGTVIGEAETVGAPYSGTIIRGDSGSHVLYGKRGYTVNIEGESGQKAKMRDNHIFSAIGKLHNIDMAIIQEAQEHFQTVLAHEERRAKCRKALMAACIYYTYLQNGQPCSDESMASLFQISTKYMCDAKKTIFSLLPRPKFTPGVDMHVRFYLEKLRCREEVVAECMWIAEKGKSILSKHSAVSSAEAVMYVAWYVFGAPKMEFTVGEGTIVSIARQLFEELDEWG